MFNFEGYLDGPRWVFTPGLIEKAAIDFGVEVSYIREEKRLLTRTVFFKVRGDSAHLKAFRLALGEGVKNWNVGR